MADKAVWQMLQNEFLECGAVCGDELTAFYVDWSDPPPRERWSVTGGNLRIRRRLSWLAEKAVIELGDKGRDGWDFWLNLLRRHSPAWVEITGIPGLCSVSADFCLKCENLVRSGRSGEFVSAEETADTAERRTSVRAKRGPRTDEAALRRVYDIVQRIAPNGVLKSDLYDICEALDEAGVAVPKSWRKKGVKTWFDLTFAGVPPPRVSPSRRSC
jgi:hypothetical protein